MSRIPSNKLALKRLYTLFTLVQITLYCSLLGSRLGGLLSLTSLQRGIDLLQLRKKSLLLSTQCCQCRMNSGGIHVSAACLECIGPGAVWNIRSGTARYVSLRASRLWHPRRSHATGRFRICAGAYWNSTLVLSCRTNST